MYIVTELSSSYTHNYLQHSCTSQEIFLKGRGVSGGSEEQRWESPRFMHLVVIYNWLFKMYEDSKTGLTSNTSRITHLESTNT